MRGQARRPRIIVVDDNRFDRDLVAEALRGPADVECCNGGEEALAALRRQPAEVVFSDLAMPDLSGLDLLERVRREHPGTDFILVTANATVDSAVAALRMGATDYLCKPIRPEELLLVLRRILDRRELLNENTRLRDAVKTLEACRALAPCLEPGEAFSVGLDLLLKCLQRSQGLALFRRTSPALSDAIVFRGLSESNELLLHRRLIEEKQVELESIQDLGVLPRSPLHPALREAGLDPEGLLAVPLRGDENESGVLFVLEAGRPFGDAEVELARIVRGHAQLALRNAEQYSRAKERAFIDDVTELYNARYLALSAEREIRRAERYGNELSVLFIDLDRFKLVNDRFGHLVGSRVLRQLGRTFAECVRQVDTLARYGGDEFTILLVDTGLDLALQVAERIRAGVAEARFDAGRGESIGVTVSVGVASYPGHGRTREELLDLADKAMYRAKSIGRNRVCNASEL